MRNLNRTECNSIVFMVNSPSDYGLDYSNHLNALERLETDYRCCLYDAIRCLTEHKLMVNYDTLVETINYSNVDYAYDILVGETCADVTPDLEHKIAQDYQKAVYAYQEIVWMYYRDYWDYLDRYKHVKEYVDQILIEPVGYNAYVKITFTEVIGTHHKRYSIR